MVIVVLLTIDGGRNLYLENQRKSRITATQSNSRIYALREVVIV